MKRNAIVDSFVLPKMKTDLKLFGDNLEVFAFIHTMSVESRDIEFFHNAEQIGKVLGMSKKRVNRAIRSLKEVDFISVESYMYNGRLCKKYSTNFSVFLNKIKTNRI